MVKQAGIYDERVAVIVEHIESFMYQADYEVGVEDGMAPFESAKYVLNYIGGDADIAPTIEMDIEYDDEGYVYFIPTLSFPTICVDEDEYYDHMLYVAGVWTDIARCITSLKKVPFDLQSWMEENNEEE